MDYNLQKEQNLVRTDQKQIKTLIKKQNQVKSPSKKKQQLIDTQEDFYRILKEMDTLNDNEANEVSMSICRICNGDNHYVRPKIFPCKNVECEMILYRLDNVCNQCIRNIQRSLMKCPFCNKGQLQINQFGQYRNPQIKKFTIGLLSTKFLTTKATKLVENPKYIPQVAGQEQLEQRYNEVPQGNFSVLPVIPFNLISLTDNIKDKQSKGKILLSYDSKVQSIEVMTEDLQNPYRINDEEKQIIGLTQNCLISLSNTCRHNLIRCGTNQIFVSGGYYKDIDFLYGLKNQQGKFIAFQDRLQDIWKNYQEGIVDQDLLVSGVTEILSQYKEILIQQGKMNPESELPFYYPYLNNTYLINFDSKDYSDYTITPSSYLSQNRAYHQTIFTNDKVYVIGGICNGYVLDSIECATVERDISSKILNISEFTQISNMNTPRANFSAVYKPAVKCTDKNCSYHATVKKGTLSCTFENCPNHEYIYITGGQESYGKKHEEFTLERYNFQTEQCQLISISFNEKSSLLKEFNGMTLGYWNNDLFVFGGVPKNQEVFKKSPTSLFVVLKPGQVKGNEKIFGTYVISDQVQPCFLPQFTVSIPYQSQTDEEKLISATYRVLIVQSRQGDNFQLFNYRIARNSKDEIQLSKIVQVQNKTFQFVDKSWIEQGFFEEQSFILLNSYIDY